MKVRMSCNYILPERDDMVSLVFQTEPQPSDGYPCLLFGYGKKSFLWISGPADWLISLQKRTFFPLKTHFVLNIRITFIYAGSISTSIHHIVPGNML